MRFIHKLSKQTKNSDWWKKMSVWDKVLYRIFPAWWMSRELKRCEDYKYFLDRWIRIEPPEGLGVIDNKRCGDWEYFLDRFMRTKQPGSLETTDKKPRFGGMIEIEWDKPGGKNILNLNKNKTNSQ